MPSAFVGTTEHPRRVSALATICAFVLMLGPGCVPPETPVLTPGSVGADEWRMARFEITGLSPQSYLENSADRLHLVRDLRLRVGAADLTVMQADGTGLTVRLASPLAPGDYDLRVFGHGVERVSPHALHVYAGDGGAVDAESDVAADAIGPDAVDGLDAPVLTDGFSDGDADPSDSSTDAGDGADGPWDAVDAGDVANAADALSDTLDGADARDDSACPGGVCAGRCADLSTDVNHCGSCGHDCTALANVVAGAVTCAGGLCQVTPGACAPGFAHCTSIVDDGCETPIVSAMHCGSCTTSCSGALPLCELLGGVPQCVSSCSAPTPTLCGASCVSTSADPSNCGACGAACPGTLRGDSTCVAGLCGLACRAGYHLCAGACVDDTSVANCGANCSPCTPPAGAISTCDGTQCGIRCNPGYGDCDGVAANGCETDLSSASHCGTCATACAAGATCTSGVCVCPLHQTFCGGACVTTAVDPQNCGRCGNACTGTTSCWSSGCVSACPAPLTNCGNTCVDIRNDSANCGACGARCAVGAGCAGSRCITAIALGPAPSRCAVNGGPPIVIDGGAAPICSGRLAAHTFGFALCACDSIGSPTLGGTLQTDAYDSGDLPYVPGGLGGSTATDDLFIPSMPVNVAGDLWIGGASGFQVGTSVSIAHDIRVQGGLTLNAALTVARNAYVGGAVTGTAACSVAGTLTTPACAGVPSTVTYGMCASAAVTVPRACRCAPTEIIPVQSIVRHYAAPALNDDAAIGLSPTALAAASSRTRLDLPCGYYYLTTINNGQPLTAYAHGHVALFVDGNVSSSGPVSFEVDPTGSLDVFVAGTLISSNGFSLGHSSSPSNLRIYVGGGCRPAGVSGCLRNADCCTGSCVAGTCAVSAATMTSFRVSNGGDLAGLVYAPNGIVQFNMGIVQFGAMFAGTLNSGGPMAIHYDRRAIGAVAECASLPTGSCASCADCDDLACVGGSCVPCTADSQCCAPLRCMAGVCGIRTTP